MPDAFRDSVNRAWSQWRLMVRQVWTRLGLAEAVVKHRDVSCDPNIRSDNPSCTEGELRRRRGGDCFHGQVSHQHLTAEQALVRAATLLLEIEALAHLLGCDLSRRKRPREAQAA